MSGGNGKSQEVEVEGFDFENVVVGLVASVNQGQPNEKYPVPITFVRLSGGVSLLCSLPPAKLPAVGVVAAFRVTQRRSSIFIDSWSFVDAAGSGEIVNNCLTLEAVAWNDVPQHSAVSSSVGVRRG